MSTQRVIIMHFDAVEQAEMRESTNAIKWCEAIGYLTTWNRTFPHVAIYADGKTDMFASYYDEEGNNAYAISAVWHGDHYEFHS